MDMRSLLGQLRSPSADVQQSALHAVFTRFVRGEVPEQLAEAVIETSRHGHPWAEILVRVISGCPTPAFEPLLRDILEAGAPHEQARAMEYLYLWKPRAAFVATLEPRVARLSQAAPPRVALLAAINLARIYDHESGWARAATVIAAADRTGPRASLRPEVDEWLTGDERDLVSVCLLEIGAAPLDGEPPRSSPAKR